jgi:hypothetical protein
MMKLSSQEQQTTLGEQTTMQFILGVFLFVVVVGLIDQRIPWPRPAKSGRGK